MDPQALSHTTTHDSSVAGMEIQDQLPGFEQGFKTHASFQVLDRRVAFEGRAIRLAVDAASGETLFCAEDVYRALGLSWLGEASIHELDAIWAVRLDLTAGGGAEETYFLAAPGVYRIAFGSGHPKTTAFADRVHTTALDPGAALLPLKIQGANPISPAVFKENGMSDHTELVRRYRTSPTATRA